MNHHPSSASQLSSSPLSNEAATANDSWMSYIASLIPAYAKRSFTLLSSLSISLCGDLHFLDDTSYINFFSRDFDGDLSSYRQTLRSCWVAVIACLWDRRFHPSSHICQVWLQIPKVGKSTWRLAKLSQIRQFWKKKNIYINFFLITHFIKVDDLLAVFSGDISWWILSLSEPRRRNSCRSSQEDCGLPAHSEWSVREESRVADGQLATRRRLLLCLLARKLVPSSPRPLASTDTLPRSALSFLCKLSTSRQQHSVGCAAAKGPAAARSTQAGTKRFGPRRTSAEAKQANLEQRDKLAKVQYFNCRFGRVWARRKSLRGPERWDGTSCLCNVVFRQSLNIYVGRKSYSCVLQVHIHS